MIGKISRMLRPRIFVDTKCVYGTMIFARAHLLDT